MLVAYNLDVVKHHFKKEQIKERDADLWRYHELLPLRNPEHKVSFGEGMTPLISFNRLAAKIGVEKLWMKDEGQLPTGSFKARGAAVGISKAKELGVKELAMPTNGNAGAAWSLYAARAGMQSHIIMPKDAPKITRQEVFISGADLRIIPGLISDAGKMIAEEAPKNGWFNVSTLKEPYRIEGKKTMGLEIAEQLGWKVPDVILYPTGGGVGLIGIYKALKELQAIGWIDSTKMPRMVSVQADGCAPIVKAFQEGKKDSEFWPNSKTSAFGINVPKALGDFLVLEAVYDTGGCAISIDDESIEKDQIEIAQQEGLFVCPEGAAVYTATKRLLASGWIRPDETVVCINTGMGIKYPETVYLPEFEG